MAENTVMKQNGKDESVTATEAEATREPERYVNPPVDIYETQDGLTVLADLPGAAQDSIGISVEDGVLTIRGTVPEKESAGSDYTEFELVSYFRQFKLGEKIDQEKIQAEYRNGVLKLLLPFAEKAKPRQIQVKVA